MIGRRAADFENLQSPFGATGRIGQHVFEHLSLHISGATARHQDSIDDEHIQRQPVQAVIAPQRLGNPARMTGQFRRVEDDKVEPLASVAQCLERLEGVRLLESNCLCQSIRLDIRTGRRQRRL